MNGIFYENKFQISHKEALFYTKRTLNLSFKNYIISNKLDLIVKYKNPTKPLLLCFY